MREPNPDVDPIPEIGPEPDRDSDNNQVPLDLPPLQDDDAPMRIPPDPLPADEQPDPPPEGDPPVSEPTRLF